MIERYGVTETAKRAKVSIRNINSRRARIERRTGDKINTPRGPSKTAQTIYPGRLVTTLKNGIAIIGGDAHYWPGHPSTGHRAFVHFIRKLKPKIVVVNGDVFDGATVSRHPSVNWEQSPSVVDELETCKARMHEILKAAGTSCELYWPLGNHDARFEARLVNVAPEYAGVHGTSLKDHFSERWKPCWAVWINDDVVCKHRYRGGDHATFQNTLRSGKTIVTNHLHSARVTPFTDYAGTRYGVDTGCLADQNTRQFAYSEDNPRNHRSAFAVLTFREGRLMMPELVQVVDENRVEFRGEYHLV
jgi:hypothetical protein